MLRHANKMLSPPSTGKKRKRIDEVDRLKKKVIDLEAALVRCRAPLADAPKCVIQALDSDRHIELISIADWASRSCSCLWDQNPNL